MERERSGVSGDGLIWGPHPEMWSADRTERARSSGFEVLVYDLPPSPGFPRRLIGWEIFTGPRYLRQVAKGEAGTYEQAKVDAAAAWTILLEAAPR